jgi:vacuolar-type H+-ATPase subunit I/STV1
MGAWCFRAQDGVTREEALTSQVVEQMSTVAQTMDNNLVDLHTSLNRSNERVETLTGLIRNRLGQRKLTELPKNDSQFMELTNAMRDRSMVLTQIQQATASRQMIMTRINEVQQMKHSSQLLKVTEDVTRTFRKLGWNTDEIERIRDAADVTTDHIQEVAGLVGTDGTGVLEDVEDEALALINRGGPDSAGVVVEMADPIARRASSQQQQQQQQRYAFSSPENEPDELDSIMGGLHERVVAM